MSEPQNDVIPASTTASESLNINEPVDFTILEASKENVQPLASGRRVTALSALLATPHAQREARLSATRKRLRINVDLALEDEEDDPLEAYSQLVHWTMENYPHGQSVESGLIELLEEATRTLKDHGNGIFKEEMKYLKLWLLYTGHVERPIIIYKFLLANEIGTNHALLYEEYAAVLERDGRRKDADEIYLLGINRRAEPLTHLKQRHKEFQIRMMVLPPLESTEYTTTSNTTSTRPNKPPGTKRAILAQTVQSSVPPPPQAIRNRQQQQQQSTSSNTPNGRFDVFSDADIPPESTFSTNEYPDIGTRITRIKENRPEKKPMAGSTIKQKGKARRAVIATIPSKIIPYEDVEETAEAGDDVGTADTPERFTVFEDDGDGGGPGFESSGSNPSLDIQNLAEPAISTTPALGMRETDHTSQSSEAEALRKDPLKNYHLLASP